MFKLHSLIFLVLVFAAPALADDKAKPILTNAKDRPNVLFIAVDDLNDWVEGLSGYTHAKTPNMTRLAQRGVMFTNAHCAAPACNPSRTSVMTGVRPSTSGVYLNQQDWRLCKNLIGKPTLPQHFRDNGYKVLGGGKLYHAASISDWGHEGFLDPTPWNEYFPSKSQQLPKEVLPAKIPLNSNEKFYRGFFDWAPLEISDDQMGDAKVVKWATTHLSKQHDDPLFLAVGIYRPHIPWYTPKKWFDEFPNDSIVLPEVKADDRDDIPAVGQQMTKQAWHQWLVKQDKWKDAVQGYLASVSFADAMIGRLLDALDNGPMADNTIIVLWSDHGYHLGHKEHWEKFALWEQTTHVPMIIIEPKSTRAKESTGKRCDRPTSLLDLYPTLVEQCGLPKVDHLEGKSLVPFLKDSQAKSDRAIVTTQGYGNHAIRSQDWRYIRYADGSEELYDHRNDPNEFENVAANTQNDSVKKELAAWIPKVNAEQHPPRKRRVKKNAEPKKTEFEKAGSQ